MADGIFPGLVSKDRNVNAASNVIFVNISDETNSLVVNADGSINIGDILPGSGALNLGKLEDTAHATGDLGVMGLAVRRDADTSLVDTDGDYAPLQVNDVGALKVDIISTVSPGGIVDDTAFGIGTDPVNPQGFLADETTPDSVDEGDIGIARMTLDRKQLHVIVDATVDSQRLAIDSAGLAQVDVAAHALTNANALPISKDNAANTVINPIFVQQVNTAITSDEVHDYDTGVAIASDATSNHDYTVTGTTFLLRSVIFSGSGAVKAEIQVGPVAGLVTKAVGFLTGRQGDTQQLDFQPPIEVPVTGTGTIRVIRTNRQGAAADVYSTIIGNDVA